MLLRRAVVLGVSCWLSSDCATSQHGSNSYPNGPGLLDGVPLQKPDTYRMVGWVVADDFSARSIENAVVAFDGAKIGVFTDHFGRYLLPSVPDTVSTITVRAIGFRPERRTFVRKTPSGL